MSAGNSLDVNSPLEDYPKRRKNRYSKTESTVQNFKQARSYFTKYLQKISSEEEISCFDVNEELANGFVTYLLNETDLKTSTAAVYVRKISIFYSFYSNKGIFEADPFSDVVARRRSDLNNEDKIHKREVSVEEMAEWVRSLNHPTDRSLIIQLAKHGKRAGEISNVDMYHINLDHQKFQALYPKTHPAIQDKPDSIYYPPNINAGDTYRGEERQSGSKSKRATIFPIDDELKDVLVKHIAIRLPSKTERNSDNAPIPLYVHSLFERMSGDVISARVAQLASGNGWYATGDGYGINITPHFFRSWFTTKFSNRSKDEQLLKYLRGDKGDIQDHYWENWGRYVRKEYTSKIYNFRH